MSRLLKKQKEMNGVLLAFLLGMAGAAAIFIPFMIVDKGFFLYCGDFNSQQIPFYTYMHGFLRTGGGTWSWATDLGTSAINSYSFYNIGSPFLWLLLPLPSRAVPYAMAPVLILKFGCISAAACLYLSRYAKTRNMAVICSLVYAFCGFNIYNVFFNHMLEPVIYFPLLLWALDGYVYERKRGWFALFVGLALLNNYFFFIGNVVFILIYFIVRIITGEYRLRLRHFWPLVLEAVIGVAIGMVLALPAFYNLIGNPRTDNFASGFGTVMYGNVQQYFAILSSMFLPPDPPYLPNLFTEGAIKWTSMSAFLPIVGMGGVIAYSKSRKGGSTKIVLFISLVMALVPFLNSSFYAFNASYYARWFYMPLLLMAFATLRALEDADINLEKGARISLILTLLFAVFGLIPTQKEGEWQLGVSQYASKFWLTFLTALLASLIFYTLVRFFKNHKNFTRLLLGSVLAFSVFYSVIHLSLGKFPQWGRDTGYAEEADNAFSLSVFFKEDPPKGYKAQQYNSAMQMQLPGEGFYRIDAYKLHDNVGLWMNQSCLQTFNSVVTPSIMEFYPRLGVKRDVSSKPEFDIYPLRGLLNVRYTIMPAAEAEDFAQSTGGQGWQFLQSDGILSVYENENFIPLGFTYNEYVTMDELEGIRTEDRAGVLMRGIGLNSEQEGLFRRLYSGKALDWVVPQQTDGDDGAEMGGWYSYDNISYGQYVEDCSARRSESSYYTKHDASGFESRIVLKDENLVFYAVPYDEGFSATINGVPAEIHNVSGGMMAVLAPAGDNTIIFRYKTRGFGMGIAITLCALAALVLYLLLFRIIDKKERKARRRQMAAARPKPVPAPFRPQIKAEDLHLLLDELLDPPEGEENADAGETEETAGAPDESPAQEPEGTADEDVQNQVEEDTPEESMPKEESPTEALPEKEEKQE